MSLYINKKNSFFSFFIFIFIIFVPIMKKDIDNIFIRYGKMHLTKQKGYGNDTFHSPPAPLGFYAMPIRFQELFLVGSIDKTQPDIIAMPKKLNFENKKEDEVFDWDKYNEIRKKKWKNIIHKFSAKNENEIWHHLDVKENVVIDKHNDWVKTTIRDWKIALIKESLKLRVQSMSTGWGDPSESTGGKNFSEVRPKTGSYSKDHFEVFFDSKVY